LRKYIRNGPEDVAGTISEEENYIRGFHLSWMLETEKL